MKKKPAVFAVILFFALCLVYFGTNKSKETSNNQDLFGQKVAETAIAFRLYGLKELTPFAWDTAYFFKPYSSAEYINKTIGQELLYSALESEDLMAIVLWIKAMLLSAFLAVRTDSVSLVQGRCSMQKTIQSLY